MKKYIGTLIKKDINDPVAGETPAVGASVTVKDYPTNNLSTIYSDDGVTQITQPILTDSAGKFEFYAANGSYNIEYDFNGDITTDTDVSIVELEKATTPQAQAGTDDTAYSTPKKVADYANYYGIGTDNAPNIPDFDSVIKSGLYGFSSTATGTRPNYSNGMLMVCTPDTNNRTVQVAVSTVGGVYQLAYRTAVSGVGDWIYTYDTANLIFAQNLSGATIVSNATTAGSNLNPAQSGTWRNVSGADVLNNNYCLFQKV